MIRSAIFILVILLPVIVLGQGMDTEMPIYRNFWFLCAVAVTIIGIAAIFYRSFRRMQSETLTYSMLHQSLASNRLVLLFFGIAYPTGSFINSVIGSSISSSRLVISGVLGLLILSTLIGSYYHPFFRKRIVTFINGFYLLIELHVLILLYQNDLLPILIIGFVLITAFSSAIFNSIRSYYVFAISIFALCIGIALSVEADYPERFEFVIICFWTLMVVAILIVVKLNLIRKLRLSDTILQKGDSIILVNNSKDQIIFASNSVEEKLGYKLDQVYGDGWWKLREEKDNMTKEQLLYPSGNFKGTRLYTNAITDASGNKKYFNWTDTKIEGGLIIGVGQDVTSIHEYQVELEKLSVIASKTDNGVVLIDALDNVEWINRAFEQITGYGLSELKEKGFADLLAGENTDRAVLKELVSIGDIGKTIDVELLLYTRAGKPVWLAINNTPIFQEETKELQWQVYMIQDISESKIGQEEMKRLSLVAKNTDNYVIISDSEDKVIWANKAFEDIFKYKVDDVIGKETASFFKTKELNPTLYNKIQQHVYNKKIPFRGELTDVDANGDHLWLSVNITPINNSEGQLEQIITLGSDITDNKLDEFQLNEYSKRLELMHEIDNILIEENTELIMINELLTTIKNSNSMYSKVSIMIFDESMRTSNNFFIDDTNEDLSFETDLDLTSFGSLKHIQSKKPYLVQDLLSEAESVSDAQLIEEGVKSYVMIPLVVGERIMGSLNVGGRYPFMFMDEEVSLIEDIAKSITVTYKQREQANKIMESEENFRQLNESLKEVFWFFDQENSKMLYVSKAFQVIFGQSSELMFENPLVWMESIVSDDRVRIQRTYLAEVFGDGFDEQFQIVHPEKGVKWVHATAIPIKNSDGEVVRISGFVEDITELKNKEEELSSLNAKLESINNINESILGNEPFGKVLISSLIRLGIVHLELKLLSILLFDFENNEYVRFLIDNQLISFSDVTERFPLDALGQLEILKSGKTNIVNSFNTIRDKKEYDRKLEKDGIKSYVQVPLVFDRELIGTLNLGFSEETQLAHELIRGLEDIAKGISLSIHQMQLKAIIESDKEEMTSKNRDITASINYARRIQTAYLPDISFIRDHFTDAHLYYRAKDIVSGDFYWWSVKNGKLLIVVADCTGHGVPGGFMTILGSQTIDKIVNTQSITDPSLLLDKLDEEIQLALGESKDTMGDGMDVAVCVLDIDTGDLTFSGARRPILYIEKGKINETKGAFKSIGEPESENVRFVTHNLQLTKGDRIFLFSDGAQDQFGGPDRPRKFSKKRMHSLLEEESNLKLSLKEHFDIVVQNLEEWVGDRELTDDITILAVEY